MTLTAFRIANFKAFAAAQRVPLRPITLVYGANSAGKSSILHALALAHHAVETGDLDTQHTQIGGESIDLGGFRQYVHRRERQVELAFEIDAGRLSGRAAELLRSARGVVVELAIGAGFTSQRRTLFGDVDRVLDPEGGARVERFAIEVDGAPLLSMSVRAGGLLRLDRLDHGHSVFRARLQTAVGLASEESRPKPEESAAFAEMLDSLVPNITAHRKGLFPRCDDLREHWMGPAFLPGEVLMGVPSGSRQDHLYNCARLFLPGVVREVLDAIGGTLDDEIRRLRYLGPLRSYPPRHWAASQQHGPNWFAGGGYAWDVVRTREDVRERVNAWLGAPNRLKTPYELVIRELVALDQLDKPIWEGMERLNQHGLSIEPDYDDEPEPQGSYPTIKDFEREVERMVETVRGADIEKVAELVLIDCRSNTPVSHRDVGIGVSQVLPVLVAAFASRSKLLAIEQPEIHLHPALQAELGDVFLGAALGEGGNTLLIESHSEHLLLRIMRRMRETNDGKLPEGVPAVRPEHVMVLFVEPDGPKSIVREMPLNERGELVKAWPGGFFEEGLRETF